MKNIRKKWVIVLVGNLKIKILFQTATYSKLFCTYRKKLYKILLKYHKATYKLIFYYFHLLQFHTYAFHFLCDEKKVIYFAIKLTLIVPYIAGIYIFYSSNTNTRAMCAVFWNVTIQTEFWQWPCPWVSIINFKH